MNDVKANTLEHVNSNHEGGSHDIVLWNHFRVDVHIVFCMLNLKKYLWIKESLPALPDVTCMSSFTPYIVANLLETLDTGIIQNPFELHGSIVVRIPTCGRPEFHSLLGWKTVSAVSFGINEASIFRGF